MPNLFDLDPLPYLIDPKAMPPILQRFFFKTLNKKHYDKNTDDVMPIPVQVSFKTWDKAFRDVINFKLKSNNFMTKPQKPADMSRKAAYSVVVGALTPQIIESYQLSALDLNKRLIAGNELRTTNMILKRLTSISEDLKKYAQNIQESRAARE